MGVKMRARTKKLLKPLFTLGVVAAVLAAPGTALGGARRGHRRGSERLARHDHRERREGGPVTAAAGLGTARTVTG
jgi:hypothetical protein